MHHTYNAILRGDHLEWAEDGAIPPAAACRVRVTVLGPADNDTADEPQQAQELAAGPRMAAILEQLANLDALAEIPDAARWEREIRCA